LRKQNSHSGISKRGYNPASPVGAADVGFGARCILAGWGYRGRGGVQIASTVLAARSTEKEAISAAFGERQYIAGSNGLIVEMRLRFRGEISAGKFRGTEGYSALLTGSCRHANGVADKQAER
jgi:hypothetical protein